MKNADLNEVSGFIEEVELESIASGETFGGAFPWGPAAVVTTTIAITATAGACPTSACTKSCWKPWS